MPATPTDRLQGLTTSVAVKPPCKAVTTTAITLNGEQTVGGTACVTGDRVLVAVTGGSVSNGIWVVDTGDWARAKDFDGSRDVVKGTFVLVAPGSNAQLWAVYGPSDPIVIGSSSIDIRPAGGDAATILLDLASTSDATKGDALLGVKRQATGSVATTLHDWIERKVFDAGTDFGVVANGLVDDTSRMQTALAAAIAARPCTLLLPRGTIRTTASLGNLAYDGLRIIGAGLKETVLKCEHASVAVTVDAFAPGLTDDDATAPFVRMDLQQFTIEGNAATTKIVDAQGLARCDWDINARVANAVSGIAYHLKGVQLSELRLRCSTDLDAMSSIPNEGLRMEAGTRDGMNIGNSSNNLLIGPRFTGLSVGAQFSGADQTIVIGGSCESNSSYGLLIGSNSRYNTFIGTGFENPDASNADASDAGISTKFINTYSVKSILLQGQSCELDGGIHERIEVQGGAVKNRVANVRVNNYASGAGGFFDSGTATKYGDIYDADLAAYIYPQKSRVNIVVGASPFTWTNNTGQHVEVITQTGTVTQVRQIRDTDNWLRPPASPNSYLLAPTDAVEVSYSVAPTMSYVPFPGLEG